MKYKAIIFDFDGVIGKTMEDNYRAWSRAFGNLGVALAMEEYFLLEGLNVKGVAETILKKYDMAITLAKAIVTQKEQYYIQDNTFEFYPGVLDLIEELRSQFVLGLVSGAGMSRMQYSAGTSFLRKFEVVISGDTVKNPKPHPESYLMVSERLSVSPLQCLVVENAPFGIESAKAANMDCVAVSSTLDRKYLSRADFIVDRIDLVKELLNNMKKGFYHEATEF